MKHCIVYQSPTPENLDKSDKGLHALKLDEKLLSGWIWLWGPSTRLATTWRGYNEAKDALEKHRKEGNLDYMDRSRIFIVPFKEIERLNSIVEEEKDEQSKA